MKNLLGNLPELGLTGLNWAYSDVASSCAALLLLK